MAFLTIVEAATTGIELYETSKKIQSKVKMLLKLVQEGYLRFAILGPGGVGKTTLAKFLTADNNYKDTAFIESAKDEDFKIGKNVLGKYWVAPGQTARIERYWPKIYRAISDGKVKGIINVVAYGYHNVDRRLKYQDLKDYYTAGMTKDDFLQNYLQKKREEEIRIVHELKHRLKDSKDKIVMITVVTKQDIWWKEKDDVENFYTTGEYSEAIKEIEKQKGADGFEHTFISLSVLANNFFIGNEVFKLVTEGYDENIRNANINNFVKQLEANL